MNIFNYDFGYDGIWNYGHLAAAAIFILIGVLAWHFKWSNWIKGGALVLFLWAITGFLILQFAVRINLPLELPTGRFLAGDTGLVLDAGAGSGRSTLMVLLARPRSRVIALDLYDGYYGITDNTPERLLDNARRAGVADRVEAEAGDMRSLPLADNSLDGAVSAFAIDHLNNEGIEKSLAEIRRVLRPGGEFLLMVINNDVWIRIAFPFLMHHGYFGPKTNIERWSNYLTGAGLEIIEQGTRPTTLFFLTRKNS